MPKIYLTDFLKRKVVRCYVAHNKIVIKLSPILSVLNDSERPKEEQTTRKYKVELLTLFVNDLKNALEKRILKDKKDTGYNSETNTLIQNIKYLTPFAILQNYEQTRVLEILTRDYEIYSRA